MSMNKVKTTLRDFLESNKGVFAYALREYGKEIQKVYKYDKGFVDLEMYPNLMLGNGVEGPKTWIAAPDLLEIQYTIPIIGGIVWDDSDECAEVIEIFGDTLNALFESTKNEALAVAGEEWMIHYGPSNDPPIVRTEYFYEANGDGQTFLRTFESSWVGYITRTAGFEPLPTLQ